MTTSWIALGSDPALGDPGVLRAIAGQLRSVEERATTVASRLHTLADAVGPDLWRGPGAQTFLSLAHDLAPATTELASAHDSAAWAVTDFANAVEVAQDAAQRAEAAGEEALRAGEEAARERAAASADVATYSATERQARQRLAEARAMAAMATDPAYLAELNRYEHQVEGQLSVALTRKDAALGREAAARTNQDAARHQLDQARSEGQALREAHDDAVRRLVGRLREHLPRQTGLLHVLGKIVDVTDKVLHPIDVIEELTKNANRVGRYTRPWKTVFNWLERHEDITVFHKRPVKLVDDLLHYKRSPIFQALGDLGKKYDHLLHNPTLKFVKKFAGLLGWISYAKNLPQNVSDLTRDGQEHHWEKLTTDSMHLGGETLQQFGPVAYLGGVGLKMWSHVIDEGKQIDWHNWPSADDFIKYGPSSFGDALKTTGKDLLDSL